MSISQYFPVPRVHQPRSGRPPLPSSLLRLLLPRPLPQAVDGRRPRGHGRLLEGQVQLAALVESAARHACRGLRQGVRNGLRYNVDSGWFKMYGTFLTGLKVTTLLFFIKSHDFFYSRIPTV